MSNLIILWIILFIFLLFSQNNMLFNIKFWYKFTKDEFEKVITGGFNSTQRSQPQQPVYLLRVILFSSSSL